MTQPPILAPDAHPASEHVPGGITEEPIVAVGGGEVFDEALQVEHYPGR
jgi:hypothetical protein